MHLWSPVPEAFRERAQRAVREAFGDARISDLVPIHGSASGALAFRFNVGGAGKLLRLEAPSVTLRNPHRFTAMVEASKVGVAPPLYFADEECGAAVMDFIETRPLVEHREGPAGIVRDAGRLVAQLQSATVFPILASYREVLGSMMSAMQTREVFAKGVLAAHAESLERICDAYCWDMNPSVSSHNDPNPGNLLFDGERLWLIDWETAYRNDPMVDLAILADNFAPDAGLVHHLLEAGLGRKTNSLDHAQLVLMRPMTRLYYAGLIFGMLPTSPETSEDRDLTALPPDVFRKEVAEGRLPMGSPAMMRQLGKACLAGALSGMNAPDIDEALRVAKVG